MPMFSALKLMRPANFYWIIRISVNGNKSTIRSKTFRSNFVDNNWNDYCDFPGFTDMRGWRNWNIDETCRWWKLLKRQNSYLSLGISYWISAWAIGKIWKWTSWKYDKCTEWIQLNQFRYQSKFTIYIKVKWWF